MKQRPWPPPQSATSLVARKSRQGEYEQKSSPSGTQHAWHLCVTLASSKTHNRSKKGQVLEGNKSHTMSHIAGSRATPSHQSTSVNNGPNDSIFITQKHFCIPNIDLFISGNGWYHEKDLPRRNGLFIGCRVSSKSLIPFCSPLWISLYYSTLFTLTQYQKYLFIWRVSSHLPHPAWKWNPQRQELSSVCLFTFLA